MYIDSGATAIRYMTASAAYIGHYILRVYITGWRALSVGVLVCMWASLCTAYDGQRKESERTNEAKMHVAAERSILLGAGLENDSVVFQCWFSSLTCMWNHIIFLFTSPDLDILCFILQRKKLHTICFVFYSIA